ncbi:hypothetical protein SRHO_G00258210 [Serrasalmus rhombeus]
MDYRTVVMKCLLFLAVNVQLASPASHSMRYMVTEVTPGIPFAEYTTLGLVDGEQFVYYDSNIRKMIPKTEWMEKNAGEDYWTAETRISRGNEENYKQRVPALMQRFNQTEGVHTFQWMYGCQQHDDGTVRRYMQYGYDGEDFLSLDLNTGTWTAANPKAVTTKHKWEVTERGAWANQIKNYLENECIDWLQKYVEYGRSTLERKVPPEVSLFQKDSSSPVVCHATGFFPKAVMISWQKNGEDLHEDHPGLKTEIRLSDHRVLSGGGSVGLIIGAVVAVHLLVAIVCVGVVIWRKKSGFKPVSQTPSDGDSSSRGSK